MSFVLARIAQRTLVFCRRNGHSGQKSAVQALGSIHLQPEVCIPALVPLLRATNGFIKTHTLGAMRAFGDGARGLVPADELTRCLQDPSDFVRSQATNMLRLLAPATPARAGVK
jgi:hypothetical protein